MKHQTVMRLTCVLWAIGTQSILAADNMKDRVGDFLRAHVIGKTLSGSLPAQKYLTATPPYESQFSRSWTFSNIGTGVGGLKYKEIVQIQQKVWAIDSQGERVGDARVMDRSYVLDVEMGHLPTADLLAGFKKTLVSTFSETTGRAYIIDKVLFEGVKLVIEYADAVPYEWPKPPPATGVNYLRARHREEYFVDHGGKLARTWTQVTSEVDPRSGAVLSTREPWVFQEFE